MLKQIRNIALSLSLCAMTALRLTAANPVEVWITPFGTGAGSGTIANPYSTPDADSFFNLIHDQRQGTNGAIVIPEYSTIHLMPGTFLVREGTLPGGQQRFCLTPKNGWKIRGAGMDVTILKVIDNHPTALTGKLQVIGGSGSASGHAWSEPVDNVEASDLTIDCNLTPSQSVGQCPSATGLFGSNNKVSRIRAINWGTTVSGLECFVFYMDAHSVVRSQGYHNNVIEDCVVDTPGPVSHTSGGTSAFAVGTSIPDDNMGGWVIRGCVAKNVTVGSGVGQPTDFHSYTLGGRGCEAHDNVALNIPGGVGGYNDTGDVEDVVWRDNIFLNVSFGIVYNMRDYNVTNLALLNNVITLTNNGTGIYLVNDYPAPTTHAMRKVQIDGNNVRPHAGGVAFALVVAGDIEFSADNNVLDGSSSGYDFYTPGDEVFAMKVLSFRNNHNLRGTPLKLVYWNDARYKTYYEDELRFVPTNSGWYKIFLQNSFSAARLNIWALDSVFVPTDIGIAYRLQTSDPGLGELTMLYNNSWNGAGEIPQVRLARWSQLGTDENSKYSSFANNAFEIYVSSSLVGQEITVRYNGMMRAPAYLAQSSGAEFQPYLQQIEPSATLTLDIGPGVRTTGSLFAGINGSGAVQQITDSNGHVVAGALNIVQPAQGGLGQDCSTQPANRFPYTTATGTFGFGTLTSFTLGLLDDPDYPTARTTLHVVPGTDVQAYSSILNTIASLSTLSGNIMVGNGSSWASVAVSQDASLASSGALTVNKLTPGANAVQGFNSATLSGTLTLTSGDARIQHLQTTSAGASQIVKLPNVAAGREFLIHNVGTRGSNTNLVVQNSSGVEQFQLAPGFFTIAESKGSDTWEFQTFGKNQPFTITTGEIDAKTVASTPLLTVPTGLNFMTTGLSVETTTLSGTPSTATPAFSMGTSTVTNSVVGMQILNSGGGVALNSYREYLPKIDAARIAAGSVLTFRLATNSTATTHKVTVHVTGFYR